MALMPTQAAVRDPEHTLAESLATHHGSELLGSLLLSEPGPSVADIVLDGDTTDTADHGDAGGSGSDSASVEPQASQPAPQRRPSGSMPSVSGRRGDEEHDAECGNGLPELGGDSDEGPTAMVKPCLPPPIGKSCPSPRFRNDFFEVARSDIAGWGAFATKALARGDVILMERPLFVADQACLFRQFDKLGPLAKDIALSLHANELVKPGTPDIQAIWATNCFTVGGRLAGLFPVAARFNHACHPAQNIDFVFDNESECLVLSVRAYAIAAGDELRISYGRDRTVAELYMTYGFRCRCGACPGLTDGDITRLTSQW